MSRMTLAEQLAKLAEIDAAEAARIAEEAARKWAARVEKPKHVYIGQPEAKP